jgi:hypothetical protein
MPVAPVISFVSVNATTTEASTVMVDTRPRSRGEAALSRHRSHKISPADRGAVRVDDGRDCVGTIVPVGVGTIDGRPYVDFDQGVGTIDGRPYVDFDQGVGTIDGRPYVDFDQGDQRVGSYGGYREALRAVPSRGRA